MPRERLFVFPAPAGMNRLLARSVGKLLCVPRARGDEPPEKGARSRMCGVFPAPAGMNRNCNYFQVARRSVPRARGDEPALSELTTEVRVCSPRPRG